MKKALFTALLTTIFTIIFSTPALADALYGTCVYQDGSKCNGTATITTSWNGKKAFPKNGRYELDFGGKVGQKITVYVNGQRYAQIVIKGNTRLDIVIK